MNSTATPPPSFAAMAEIIADVARLTAVSPDDIASTGLANPAVRAARNLAMAIMRVSAGLSLDQIATLYYRERASILSAFYHFAARLQREPEFAAIYQALLADRPVRAHLINPTHTHRLVADLRTPRADKGPLTVNQHQLADSTHGRLDQLNESTLRRRLLDAEDQLTYWQGAKVRAARDQDRADAGARVTLWEMQVEAIRRRLREMNRAEQALAS